MWYAIKNWFRKRRFERMGLIEPDGRDLSKYYPKLAEAIQKIIDKNPNVISGSIKEFKLPDLKNRGWTWKCDICGEVRDDNFIDVISYPLLNFEHATRNLKYCKDKIECCLKAEQRKTAGIM